MVKHSSRKAVAAALVATLAAAAPALADGTETLGDPSIPIATGTGSVVAGVGTHAFPNTATTLNVNVPAGSLVKQVLVYWEGHVTWPTYQGDNNISINGTATPGTLIGGPTNFFFAEDFSTYRADITARNLISAGANSLTVSDMNFGTDFNPPGNGGVGVLVIYDNGSASKFVGVKDGSDVAFKEFVAPKDTTVPQTLNFTGAGFQRSGTLNIMAASVSGPDLAGLRGNIINGSFNTGQTFSIVNGLQSNQGQEFDAANFPITVPANATSMTLQIISEGGVRPASLDWITAAASIEEPPPPPPGGQGCTPGYWKNHLDAWTGTGYSPNQALSTVFSPTGLSTLGSNTLLQALSFSGGSSLTSKKQILLRAAVASLLNSAHPGVDFSMTTAEVIAAVNAALLSNDAATILALATELDNDNNAGCTLN